jgi:hypothetical protein
MKFTFEHAGPGREFPDEALDKSDVQEMVLAVAVVADSCKDDDRWGDVAVG